MIGSSIAIQYLVLDFDLAVRRGAPPRKYSRMTKALFSFHCGLSFRGGANPGFQENLLELDFNTPTKILFSPETGFSRSPILPPIGSEIRGRNFEDLIQFRMESSLILIGLTQSS